MLRMGRTRLTAGADGLSATTRLMTYSRLVGLDPRTSAVYGDLADEVEVPEPLLVRFRLREGRFFHPDTASQAQPLIAQSVMGEFERRKAEGVFLFTDVIDAVEASSDTELTIRLKAPFSLLFEFLAQSDASIRYPEPYDVLSAPRGSGAFMPVSHTDAETVYQANPLLERPEAPRLKEVHIRWADHEAELDGLFAQGEIDLREHPDEVSHAAASGVAAKFEVSRATRRMRGLAISLLPPRDQASQESAEAFRDERVRRALAIAINRDALRDLDDSLLTGPVGPAFGGDALPAAEIASHSLYQHSSDGAASLLRAAGHEGLAIRISHSDTPSLFPHAQQIVADLTAAGFLARLVTRPAGDFESAFAGGDFEAAFFEVDGLSTPDLGLRLHTTGGLDGHGSPWGYSNPVYDAQVQATLSEIDPLLRTRRSRDAQRLLLDDVPGMFPLTTPREYASIATGVRGFEFDGYGFNYAVLAPHWEAPASNSR